MATVPRIDVPEYVYHVYNRANAAGTLFESRADYEAFESIFLDALKEYPLNIYAYCIMPNHWHFVCAPLEPGGLGEYFRWISGTHAKRWHANRNNAGAGHIYQDRFKSNICSKETGHFLQLVRYVERNALRAKLVPKAEEWRWGSAWRRTRGTFKEKSVLAEWPVDTPADYLTYLNAPQAADELDSIRKSIKRGSPFGPDIWRSEMVALHGLEVTVRPRGRPKK